MPEERSIFQKIGDSIADFAPGIATILTATGVGAPIGAAVGAVGALSRAFGLGSAAKPEDVLQAISADPEIRLKAMIAENGFRAEMGRQEIEKLRVQLADVQSARSRQVESEKAIGKKDWNLYILAYLGVGLPFILVGYFIYYGLPKMTPETALMVGGFVGIILSKYGSIFDYFFGSSQGSATKSQELAQIAMKK
jgi:hypothetical protein